MGAGSGSSLLGRGGPVLLRLRARWRASGLPARGRARRARPSAPETAGLRRRDPPPRHPAVAPSCTRLRPWRAALPALAAARRAAAGRKSRESGGPVDALRPALRPGAPRRSQWQPSTRWVLRSEGRARPTHHTDEYTTARTAARTWRRVQADPAPVSPRHARLGPTSATTYLRRPRDGRAPGARPVTAQGRTWRGARTTRTTPVARRASSRQLQRQPAARGAIAGGRRVPGRPLARYAWLEQRRAATGPTATLLGPTGSPRANALHARLAGPRSAAPPEHPCRGAGGAVHRPACGRCAPGESRVHVPATGGAEASAAAVA